MDNLPLPGPIPNPPGSTSTSTSSGPRPKLYLLDYGAGNVRSLANSIHKLGYDFEWIKEASDFDKAEVSWSRGYIAGVGGLSEPV